MLATLLTSAGLFDMFAGASSIKTLLNPFIGKYGRIEDIEIDKASRMLRFAVQLNGESEIWHLQLHNYHVQRDASGQHFFSFDRADCNRPWLANFLNDFMAKRAHAIPEPAFRLLA